MPKVDLKLDPSDFLKKMKKLGKITPEAVDRGLGRAGMILMRDAAMEQPTIPLKEGTLRGSGSVHIEGKRLATGEGLPGAKKGTPAENVPVGSTDRVRVAVVGFNQPQAARLHEHPEFKFTEPGSGGKFLETKMQRHRKDYMAEVADAIKEDLSRA